MNRGFTLLEVLVAMAILGLALVAMMQLTSQGLRLLRVSEDYQGAVRLADRLTRIVDSEKGGVQSGQEGPLRWERRTMLVPVPEKLNPAIGPRYQLYAVSVTVRWGSKHALELDTLRTVVGTPDGSTPES